MSKLSIKSGFVRFFDKLSNILYYNLHSILIGLQKLVFFYFYLNLNMFFVLIQCFFKFK